MTDNFYLFLPLVVEFRLGSDSLDPVRRYLYSVKNMANKKIN